MTLPPFRFLRRPSVLLPALTLLAASHVAYSQISAQAKSAATPDHAAAYYHDGLAHLYEELAIGNGRSDYAAQAVEEYKLALNADPDSKYLQDGLADLYFKLGRIREAVTTAQEQVRKDPTDVQAHDLLGKVYLRSLNDMQGPQANDMLQQAIGEYETLAKLKPKDLETHLLLGQLYGLNHDSAKAEAQFKIAEGLDSNSDDAVLNIARLYSEQGQTQRAVDSLNGIPADDRSERVNLALAGSYDQLKQYKKAAAAYRAALEDDSDNVDTQKALANSLLLDNDLAGASVVYKGLVDKDASDIGSQVKLSEIQRRQGHYDDALATLNKAKTAGGNTDNLELAFNQALLYDALGKYEDAIVTLRSVLLSTAKPDNKYSDPEKSNRAIFLDRLGIVYREQNKTADAIDVYKQMIPLGGEYAMRGYQGEVDSYRDAHQWKDAVAAAATSAQLYPKDHSVQLTYAYNLATAGEQDKGLALANAQLNGTSDDRDTQIAIANIDLAVHRSADALTHLDKAEILTPKPDDRFGIYLLRATVYDRDKQYDQAEQQYRKALAVDPENAIVLNDLGYMYAERGVRLQEALGLIQRAVVLEPQNGAYLDSLGWVQFKLGDYKPAEENLHKAIDRTPSDASIHDHLGEVYEKTGRLKLAVAQWERAMTEYARSLPVDTDPAEVAKVKHKLDDARTKLARVSGTTQKKS